jgi:hypothetical protein
VCVATRAFLLRRSVLTRAPQSTRWRRRARPSFRRTSAGPLCVAPRCSGGTAQAERVARRASASACPSAATRTGLSAWAPTSPRASPRPIGTGTVSSYVPPFVYRCARSADEPQVLNWCARAAPRATTRHGPADARAGTTTRARAGTRNPCRRRSSSAGSRCVRAPVLASCGSRARRRSTRSPSASRRSGGSACRPCAPASVC